MRMVAGMEGAVLKVNLPRIGACIIGTLVAGCVGREVPTTETRGRTNSVLVAGWYTQSARGALFQPCGSPALQIEPSTDLRERARDFGLQADLPVYVRLLGSRNGNSFDVAAVEQFGSAVPIHDCPMTGTTIQR